MNNKIQNTMDSINPKEFNNMDILKDSLTSLKSVISIISIFNTEASNDDLRQKVLKCYSDALSIQRDTFNMLFKKGFYALTKAPSTEISEELNKFMNFTKQS